MAMFAALRYFVVLKWEERRPSYFISDQHLTK